MGPLLQGKAWLLGTATLVAGAVLATVLYNALLAPDAPAPGSPPPSETAEPAMPEPAPGSATIAPVAPEGAPDQSDAPVTMAEPAPPPAAPQPAAPPAIEQPAIEPPVFDVVRVAEDGGALVAGSAAPEVSVVLRVEGTEVARVAADAGGQFVAMFMLEPSDSVQILSLEMVLGDGRVVPSQEQVVLTPRPALVAALEPEAEPEAAAEPVATPPQDVEAAAGAAPADRASAEPAPAPVAPERVAEPEPVAESEPVAEPEPAVPAIPRAPATPPEPATAITAMEENPLPRAFVVGAGGEVRLLDRAPQVMDNVVIDLIAYSAQGEVQISGRAASAGGESASLQIYLDNRPVAAARADGGNWALDLPDVDPGVYTLRVDQINDEGRVVSRFETPFQREAPELVVAAQARLAQQDGALAAGELDVPAPASAPEPEPEPAPSAEAPAVEAPVAEVSAPPVAVAPPVQPGSPEPASPAAPPAAEVATAPSAAPPAVANATASGAQAPVVQASGAPSIALVTVQPGESLWRISREHYGEGDRYVVIYRANRSQIRDPDLIFPGQIFVLPE